MLMHGADRRDALEADHEACPPGIGCIGDAANSILARNASIQREQAIGGAMLGVGLASATIGAVMLIMNRKRRFSVESASPRGVHLGISASRSATEVTARVAF
jgi:beta-lactamase regulating signal transducer with metallopeptidase domain